MVMKAKACRCLFGSPNHDQIENELKARLKELSLAESEKWNFDFGSDSPLRGRYDWQPVQTDDATSYVPSFYTSDRSSECSAKRKSKTLKRPHQSVVGLSYARLEDEAPREIERDSIASTSSTNLVAPNEKLEPRLQVSPIRVPIPERGLRNTPKRRKLGKSKSYVMKATSAKKTTQTTLPSLFRVIKHSGRGVSAATVKSTLSNMR